MAKIDIARVADDTSSTYPEEFRRDVIGRERKRLGNAAALTQFGVNLCRLKPGAASSHRHWHQHEDEFVYVLEGEVVLAENDGETILRPGDAAGWKAGVANGHRLINRSSRDAIFLEVGTRSPVERVDYPDIDMRAVRDEKGGGYVHKDGTPYPKSERR